MKEKIQKILDEKAAPILASHRGGVTLLSYENQIATVKLLGECSGCPSAQQTTEEIVKTLVMKELPEVKDVVLDTSVSEDLLAFARKILQKEI